MLRDAATTLLPIVTRLTVEELRARRDFEPFRPGVEIARIYEDPESGASAALLRYAPGARVPEHRHVGYEHVLVLDGEQSDERGCYPAGTLVVNPPGLHHSVSSRTGCLALLIWQKPVDFVSAK